MIDMHTIPRYLATGSKDATVIIWELDPELMQLRQSKILEEHSYGVVYMAWSPDSTRLAVCGPEDGFEVWIWDVTLGRMETKVSSNFAAQIALIITYSINC